MTTTTTITARARAFQSEPIQAYRFEIEPDGTVRVYDSVAGHYTLCHSLSRSAISRLRRLAAEVSQ